LAAALQRSGHQDELAEVVRLKASFIKKGGQDKKKEQK
jgi:hypothetical protein